MIKEFKEFISIGNVIDLAVGVIIGGAFGKIVTSLVNDILMPLIGIIMGGIDFTNLVFKIGDAEIAYGSFIQNILDFLIIAFCIFLFVKASNKITKLAKKKEEEKGKKEEINEISLLKDIKEELQKQNKKSK